MIMISRLALLAGLEVELLDVVLLDLPQPIQAVLVPSDLPFVLLDLLQPIHIYVGWAENGKISPIFCATEM